MIGLRLGLILLASFAVVDAVAAENKLSGWQKVSEAKLNWLWVDVYNAELFVNPSRPLSQAYQNDGFPLSLRLCYLRNIDKTQLVEAANEGLEWLKDRRIKQEVVRLHSAYQDVTKGDCYRLTHLDSGETQLKFNEKVVFTSKAEGFKSVYFGLWLGDKALSKSLSRQLVGQ